MITGNIEGILIRMLKSRKMGMTRACSTHGGLEQCTYDFDGKDSRKDTTRCSSMDNNKMNLSGIGWGGMDWINPAQKEDQWRALANMIMNFWVPYNILNFY
jgi:hypothetical protein